MANEIPTARGMMAESNERLVRVETRLDGQEEMLIRLERHMESMSSSYADMAAAVEKIPTLISQMLEVQKVTVDQNLRLASLEMEMQQSRQARERLRNVVEPRVSRNHFIASATAWFAGICVAAIITASIKGWIR